MTASRRLEVLHAELDGCRRCGSVIGPVVHGPALPSPILLVGQAPGPHEGKLNRPFAWTAGKTLFRWFHDSLGVSEEAFRAHVYMSAVLRCFPGKAKGGGDRRPAPDEIANCRTFLAAETAILQPELILPVGTMAIEQVIGHKGPLVQVIGKQLRTIYHGHEADVICLPHPSGASTWHRGSPGKELLREALALIGNHPAAKKAFP